MRRHAQVYPQREQDDAASGAAPPAVRQDTLNVPFMMVQWPGNVQTYT